MRSRHTSRSTIVRGDGQLAPTTLEDNANHLFDGKSTAGRLPGLANDVFGLGHSLSSFPGSGRRPWSQNRCVQLDPSTFATPTDSIEFCRCTLGRPFSCLGHWPQREEPFGGPFAPYGEMRCSRTETPSEGLGAWYDVVQLGEGPVVDPE